MPLSCDKSPHYTLQPHASQGSVAPGCRRGYKPHACRMLELPVCGFMNSQESRLMKFERLIWTSLNRSPGFSRSRLPGRMPRPWQAFHRRKPGLPDGISRLCFQRSSAGSVVPGRMLLLRQAFHRLKPGLLDGSTFISRISRSWQDAGAPAGIPPAKAGTPGWLNVHQSDQSFLAGYRGPGRHSTG
jgi:hypothetical protein